MGSWLLYGVMKNCDWFLIVPNSIGLCLCFIQIFLWFKFRKSSSEKEKDIRDYAECPDEEEKVIKVDKVDRTAKYRESYDTTASSELNRSADYVETKVLI